jgi:hypothetical protein
VMVSPMVSRSRASVVENTFTPVKGALAMRPSSYIRRAERATRLESYSERALRERQAASSRQLGPMPSGCGPERGPVRLLHPAQDAVALPLPPLGPSLLGDLLGPLPRGLRAIGGHRARHPSADIDNTACRRRGGPDDARTALPDASSRVCRPPGPRQPPSSRLRSGPPPRAVRRRSPPPGRWSGPRRPERPHRGHGPATPGTRSRPGRPRCARALGPDGTLRVGLRGQRGRRRGAGPRLRGLPMSRRLSGRSGSPRCSSRRWPWPGRRSASSTRQRLGRGA